MKLVRPHHQAIWQILEGFDASFLLTNKIFFGGGTRIAMELGEYRESVDIDLFCIGRDAYKAARSAISSNSFGPLFRQGCEPSLYQNRDIRADRDAIRSLLDCNGRPLKLEIIHFDHADIFADVDKAMFPVPSVGRGGCFATKLLANADRYRNNSKDIVDLCMMRREWGAIPNGAWQAACEHYSEQVIVSGLDQALYGLINDAHKVTEELVLEMKMDVELVRELIGDTAPVWRQDLIAKLTP